MTSVALLARSLDPLVKTRVFGMTPCGRGVMFRNLHHRRKLQGTKSLARA